MSEVSRNKSIHDKVATYGVLLIAAVAAVAFLYSSDRKSESSSGMNNAAASASSIASAAGDSGASADTADTNIAASEQQPEAPKIEIEPGNPVVAKIDGQDITRSDVFAFISGLPQNVRQMPLPQLFDISVEQLVNARIVEEKAKGAKLDNDDMVKEQLAAAKEQIVRNVYVQREIDKRITDDKINDLYKNYSEQLANVEETKARHILVDSEEKANEIIGMLRSGTEFADLAKSESKGPSASRGGDLGWFAKGEMVPEFSDAAFAAAPGTVVGHPVKSQFGYHVIEVEDRRKREVPALDSVRPMLEAQLRRQALDTIVKEWRKDSEIEIFDINGKDLSESDTASAESSSSIEPASGE